MNAIDVVGLGAMNMDLLYRVERLLTDGETPVEEFRMCPGGSAANTIYALAKLGVQTGFVGAVGDDEAGRTLLADFQSVGLDTSQIAIKKEARTGSALALTDRQGNRALYVMPGANSLLAEQDLDLEYLNQANLIHFSSFVDDRQFDVQKRVLGNLSPQPKVSFAPGALYAAKGLEALAPFVKRTHILFLNRDEVQKLTSEEFEAGARRCLERGCQIVVVTLGKGSDGESYGRRAICYIATPDRSYLIEAPRVEETEEIETTGAGDAFAAGFLYGILRGKELDQCAHVGDIVARFSIAQMGARAGLPTLSQLSQAYERPRGRSL